MKTSKTLNFRMKTYLYYSSNYRTLQVRSNTLILTQHLGYKKIQCLILIKSQIELVPEVDLAKHQDKLPGGLTLLPSHPLITHLMLKKRAKMYSR